MTTGYIISEVIDISGAMREIVLIIASQVMMKLASKPTCQVDRICDIRVIIALTHNIGHVS